jgi:hypothetical protein
MQSKAKSSKDQAEIAVVGDKRHLFLTASFGIMKYGGGHKYVRGRGVRMHD